MAKFFSVKGTISQKEVPLFLKIAELPCNIVRVGKSKEARFVLIKLVTGRHTDTGPQLVTTYQCQGSCESTNRHGGLIIHIYV